MIREDFIKRKISLIEDELEHLSVFSKYTFEEVAKDFVKQAAVERFLERIINRAIDINQYLIAELAGKNISPPKDYTETFLALSQLDIYTKEFAEQISKSVGTRNVLVHEYDKVNNSKIYGSISNCLKDYRQYCGYILKFIDKN